MSHDGFLCRHCPQGPGNDPMPIASIDQSRRTVDPSPFDLCYGKWNVHGMLSGFGMVPVLTLMLPVARHTSVVDAISMMVASQAGSSCCKAGSATAQGFTISTYVNRQPSSDRRETFHQAPPGFEVPRRYHYRQRSRRRKTVITVPADFYNS